MMSDSIVPKSRAVRPAWLRWRSGVSSGGGAAIPRSARYVAADAGVIASGEDLRCLQPGFQASLHVPLQVQALAARLCPVLLADGSAAVFAVPGAVGSDQADALERRLCEHGYPLARPSRYAVAPPLLLAIVRGQALNGKATDDPAGAQAARHTPTALADVFQDIVDWGVCHDASDIHVNLFTGLPHSEVRFSLAGRYVAPERFRGMHTTMLADMLAVAWMDINGGNGAVFDPSAEQQGSMWRRCHGREMLLRWSSLAAESGPSVCLRLLDRNACLTLPSLETLGYLPEQASILRQAVQSEGGAIVLSGSVGSGKSTSLAVMMAAIPSYRKIITIEDPIEYRIPGAIQNAVCRDLGADSHQAYATKLRSLKRAAMNDVLLGEVRDQETGRAFTDLASAGIGVYTTVHAPSAARIIDRLSSRFIDVPPELLSMAGILKLLVHQVLLPRLCAHCAMPTASINRVATAGGGVRRQTWSRLLWRMGYAADAVCERNPSGCVRCRHAQVPQLNGYAGRIAAVELLQPWQPDPVSAKGHAGHAVHAGISAQALRDVGVSPALLHAFWHVAQGTVDPHDIEQQFLSFDVLESRLAGQAAAAPQILRAGVGTR